MTKAEDAVALFQQGFNCTQSILSVFAPDVGLDQDMARRISQGFGSGMGRTDNICGSLSAAIMVIGLRYGGIRTYDFAQKEKTYAAVGEFLHEFKARYGSIACTDLLGYNLSDLHQFADAKTNDVARERCPTFIRTAVELVQTLL